MKKNSKIISYRQNVTYQGKNNKKIIIKVPCLNPIFRINKFGYNLTIPEALSLQRPYKKLTNQQIHQHKILTLLRFKRFREKLPPHRLVKYIFEVGNLPDIYIGGPSSKS